MKVCGCKYMRTFLWIYPDEAHSFISHHFSFLFLVIVLSEIIGSYEKITSQQHCVIYCYVLSLTHLTSTLLKKVDNWNVSFGNWVGIFSGMNTASGGTRHSPSKSLVSTLCEDILVSYMFYFMLELSTWIKWCSFWKILE